MQKGFTLLEVLVALGLLAIVLVALLRMETNSISLASRNHTCLRALNIASDEMDHLMGRQLIGEYTNERKPFTVMAKSETQTDSGVLLEVTTVRVTKDGVLYAQLKKFVVKAI